MGKKRDLFKKIRDPKGTFHAKMGTIKDIHDWTQMSSAHAWVFTFVITLHTIVYSLFSYLSSPRDC